VDAAVVVVHEVQGDGSLEVVELLAEGVGQAREPPHAHPHGQVCPFNVAGANLLLGGMTDDLAGFHGYYLSRRIAAPASDGGQG